MPRRSQAQLIHAKASAKAQLINAHQMGGGAGGSAPLVQAHAVPSRKHIRSSAPVEVGGDKKKDKPTGVAIADKVDVSGKGRTVNDGSGLTQWRVGNKRFTQAEFDNIMDRGMRGASLNAEQRAVFEASRKEYEEEQAEKKRLAEEKRVRDIKNADRIEEEKRQNAEYDRRQEVQREAALADEQRRRAYAQEDFDRRQKAILDAEKRAADAENEKRIARNRQYGLPDDYQATDADYKGLANRTHEYGYSPENQKRVDDFNAEIAKVREDSTLSPEQRDAAIADLQGRIDGIGKAVYKRPDAVAEPQMSTIKGDDGQEYRVWSPDGKSWQLFDKKDPVVKEPTMNGLTFKDYFGKFVGLEIPNPAYDAKAAEDDAEYKVSKTLTLTPEQAMERARQSWKPDANIPAPTDSAPTPQGGGSAVPTPAPTAQESTPTPQPEDIKSKWSQYED